LTKWKTAIGVYSVFMPDLLVN